MASGSASPRESERERFWRVLESLERFEFFCSAERGMSQDPERKRKRRDARWKCESARESGLSVREKNLKKKQRGSKKL